MWFSAHESKACCCVTWRLAAELRSSGTGGDEESPYSEAAQALLALPDGSMPDLILKLEPPTVNTVCNDIIETSSAIQWDDIAGVLLH